jgi:hypothetical protein
MSTVTLVSTAGMETAVAGHAFSSNSLIDALPSNGPMFDPEGYCLVFPDRGGMVSLHGSRTDARAIRNSPESRDTIVSPW